MCIRDSYGIDKEMDVKEFYQQMRGGMMPTTSQVNPETAKEYLENYLEECSELLVLSFSSGPVSYTHLDVYKRQC